MAGKTGYDDALSVGVRPSIQLSHPRNRAISFSPALISRFKANGFNRPFSITSRPSRLSLPSNFRNAWKKLIHCPYGLASAYCSILRSFRRVVHLIKYSDELLELLAHAAATQRHRVHLLGRLFSSHKFPRIGISCDNSEPGCVNGCCEI